MLKAKQVSILIMAIHILSACGEKTVRWEQQVQLQDGRVIVTKRISEQTGKIFPENIVMEKSQRISFINPETNERITWDIPSGLKPYALDFEKNTPYMVLSAYTVANYNKWNCPNPPYLAYRYKKNEWTPITIEQLPQKMEKRNLIDMSKEFQRFSSDDILTISEHENWLKDLPKDRRSINREKIHPIALGCWPDTLVKQGRESEINVKYRD